MDTTDSFVTGRQAGMDEENKSKTDAQWRQELSDEQYQVCRCKGTEQPFSGQYNDFKEEGVFTCACCAVELFSSDHKYDSGSGWPSFYQTANKENVKEESDQSLAMARVEVLCNQCGAHLGHVFEDGPPPSNLRYCINSIALNFSKNKS